MVLLLFFCSGATALVYEVVWSKYLSLLFGSTVQAQTVVLAVFMGGLALGNWLIGKRSDLLERPLRVYGYFEIAIGLYAFFFNFFYQTADKFFVGIGAGMLDQSTLLLLFKAVLSIGLLLGPTLLMGGTLPLLAAWLQKNTDDAGRRSARFYSVNSLGAVFGSFLAGFILVQSIGLMVTLQLTALANVIIGALAILLSRRYGSAPSTTKEVLQTGLHLSAEHKSFLRRGCLMVALTGAASMGLEVLAARGLSLIFGASLHAFAVVLMAFILGIGIGSANIASPRWQRLKSENTIVVLLFAAALWIALIIFNIEGLVYIYRHLKSGLAQNSVGYIYYELLTAVISLFALGIPAGLLGSVLPLWIRIISGNSEHLGAQVGRLLTANTIGAVVGVLLTGFLLMPQAGLRGALGIVAAILGAGAIVIALNNKNKIGILASATVSIVSLAAAFTGGEDWKYVLNSGVFRARETTVSRQSMANLRLYNKMLFCEDAADATVVVEQEIAQPDNLTLKINGKSDASSQGDLSTQFLLAHLPLLTRPDATNVFVLGLGSGITAGALLGHPVQQITIAENCEPVLRAAAFFAPWNEGILTNSRARICSEDARTILKLDPQKYDVVICEPSNPWTVGIGSVFSREFYELAASRLADDGVICQWFHIYEMNDDIVFLVLRTFGSVFPFFEVWEPKGGDLLLVGAKKPFKADTALYQRIFERELPRKQLEAIGIRNPALMLARQISSQKTSFAIPGPGPVQSDNFPILEYQAPKAFYFGQYARQLFDFDERTWQRDLASVEKQTLLSALDNESLKGLFTEYPSSNPFLSSYLRTRFQTGKSEADIPVAGVPLPCIFNPSQPTSSATALGENEKLSLLRDAWVSISSPDAVNGVSRMKSILQTESFPSQLVPQVSYYILRAIKTCLRRGDSKSALELWKLGVRLNPEGKQFAYLERLMEREAFSTPR